MKKTIKKFIKEAYTEIKLAPDNKIKALTPNNEQDLNKLREKYPFCGWLIDNNDEGFRLYNKLALGDRTTTVQQGMDKGDDTIFEITPIDMGLRYHVDPSKRIPRNSTDSSIAFTDDYKGDKTDDAIVNMTYDEKQTFIKPEYLRHEINGKEVGQDDFEQAWKGQFADFCRYEKSLEMGTEWIFRNTEKKHQDVQIKGLNGVYTSLATYLANCLRELKIFDLYGAPNSDAISIEKWLGTGTDKHEVTDSLAAKLKEIGSMHFGGKSENNGIQFNPVLTAKVGNRTMTYSPDKSMLNQKLMKSLDIETSRVSDVIPDPIDEIVFEIHNSIVTSNVKKTTGVTALISDLNKCSSSGIIDALGNPSVINKILLSTFGTKMFNDILKDNLTHMEFIKGFQDLIKSLPINKQYYGKNVNIKADQEQTANSYTLAKAYDTISKKIPLLCKNLIHYMYEPKPLTEADDLTTNVDGLRSDDDMPSDDQIATEEEIQLLSMKSVEMAGCIFLSMSNFKRYKTLEMIYNKLLAIANDDLYVDTKGNMVASPYSVDQ